MLYIQAFGVDAAPSGGPGRTALPIDGTCRRVGTDRPTLGGTCRRAGTDRPTNRWHMPAGRDGPPYQLMAHAGGPETDRPTVNATRWRAEPARPTIAIPDFARFPSQHLKA
jgi:hypothetical protein